VLAAAHELLVAGGVEALTMRRLASRLDVAPNALYSHVVSKTQLLDDLLDDLLSQVDTPPAEAEDPVAALAALMTSTYAVLTAHPSLVPLYLARQGARGANAVRLGERMDALLTRAGVPDRGVPEARRVLIVHTIGFAAFSTGANPADGSAAPVAAEEAGRNFARGLQWVLAGIVQDAGASR
jgi:AcrR family transcriptional regulator